MWQNRESSPRPRGGKHGDRTTDQKRAAVISSREKQHPIYRDICVASTAHNRARGSYVLGLYTILLLPVLYGVWHTNGRSEGGRILPNTRVIVLHQGVQFRWARGMIGWLIRAQKSRGKRISCKGQLRTYRSCHERRHMRTREETHRKTACANGRDPGETLRL